MRREGLCGEKEYGNGCTEEEKERKTEADSIMHDLTEKGLSGKMAQDRVAWRRLIRNNDRT